MRDEDNMTTEQDIPRVTITLQGDSLEEVMAQARALLKALDPRGER